jgi:hypothetical protein
MIRNRLSCNTVANVAEDHFVRDAIDGVDPRQKLRRDLAVSITPMKAVDVAGVAAGRVPSNVDLFSASKLVLQAMLDTEADRALRERGGV